MCRVYAIDARGARGSTHAAGNAVVLAHANREFSLLTHLRKGSIAVKPGPSVHSGQLLGVAARAGTQVPPACPDGWPELFAAESFPMPSNDVILDGKRVAPVELVSPAPPRRGHSSGRGWHFSRLTSRRLTSIPAPPSLLA
jgi:hypothetical protein